MSHLVTIPTRIRDEAAVRLACQRMHLPAPARGSAQLFSETVDGLLVRLPEWTYPIVIDTQSGEIKFDNYGGTWGDQVQLDNFLQAYAVEVARLEARKKGYACTETTLADGSIRVQIQEGC